MKYFVIALFAISTLVAGCDKSKSAIEQVKSITEDKYPVANMPDEPLEKPLEIVREPKRLAMTSTWSAGVKDDGTLWTWGTGSLLGGRRQSLSPVKVEGVNDAVAVSGGSGHMLLLRKDGTVWGWGSNHDGQIDPNDKDTSIEELRHIKGIDNVVDIVAGTGNSFFLKNDGTVYVLGDSKYGVANGKKLPRLAQPIKLEGFSDIIKIEGSVYILALNKVGEIFSQVPVINFQTTFQGEGQYKVGKIILNKKVIDIGHGFANIVLLDDGTVWSWGDDEYAGQGNKTANIKQPAKINGLSKVTRINGTSANTSDGKLYIWGTFAYKSSTSVASKQYVYKPILIKNDIYVEQFAKGFGKNGLIDTTGNAWFWGDNELGRRGTGKAYPEKFAPKDYLLTPEKSLFNIHH